MLSWVGCGKNGIKTTVLLYFKEKVKNHHTNIFENYMIFIYSYFVDGKSILKFTFIQTLNKHNKKQPLSYAFIWPTIVLNKI